MDSSTTEIKRVLYDRCASLPSETIFSQQDIINLKIIPNDDIKLLQEYTSQLTREGLFKLHALNKRAHWRVVKKQDAQKYKSLNGEEALVYNYIESAGREGIWTKMLRTRSNLHMTLMTRALKTLENKGYVKQIKSVKFPRRKTYMLASLQPSEDVTGGPFYTDGVLDEEFVHHMARWIERYIIARSWYYPPAPTTETTQPPSKTQKRKRGSEKHMPQKDRVEEIRNSALNSPAAKVSKTPLPFPPGYTGYPTLSELTTALNASGLSTEVNMNEVETKQLLDALVWDGRIERNRFGHGYKATRKTALSAQRHPKGAADGKARDEGVESWSALTEAPCGKCPVRGICAEDGPVNARTCEYFAEWLEI